MDEESLEKALIKAVKYYFKGLSAKEAVNKAFEEVKERWKYGVNLSIYRKMEWRMQRKKVW